MTDNNANTSIAYTRYLRHTVPEDTYNKSKTGRQHIDISDRLSCVTHIDDKSEDIIFPNVRNLVHQYNEMFTGEGLRDSSLREFSSCGDIFSVNVTHRKRDALYGKRVDKHRKCSTTLTVPTLQLTSSRRHLNLKERRNSMWRAQSHPDLFTSESLQHFKESPKLIDSDMSDEGCLQDLSSEDRTPSPTNCMFPFTTDAMFRSKLSAASEEEEELSGNLKCSQWKRTVSSDSAVGADDDLASCPSLSPVVSVRHPFEKGRKGSIDSNNESLKDPSLLRKEFPKQKGTDYTRKDHRRSSCRGAEHEVILRRKPGRSVIRTPSVIISDHSYSDRVSMRIAMVQNEVSLCENNQRNMDTNVDKSSPIVEVDEVILRKKSDDCPGCDRLVQSELCFSCVKKLGYCLDCGRKAISEFSGLKTDPDCILCTRKLSDCSTCSSISTIDLNGPGSNGTLNVSYDWTKGDLSDCSSSYLTASDDDTEVVISTPPPPVAKKVSNWRKVRNVVQWTPFIQTYKRHKYPWVQLAGHQGNFKAGYRQGTILKKLCPAEESAFEMVKKDVLRSYVPDYMGVVESSDGEKYLQLQDLLTDFTSPCVMDIKMGVRTYLEEELAKARHKPKLRKDMYEKMVQIDPNAPTDAEKKAKAVTKPRYMVWRETISSTATLGFRIEGVRRGDGSSTKDFKTTRTREQVLSALAGFIEGYPHTVPKYIQRLKAIKATLSESKFFNSHELIGSSLLFVHSEDKAGVWLIDFAKSVPLPNSVRVTHKNPWVEGTHEDGYLIGLDNLIDLFERFRQSPNGNKTNIVAEIQKDAEQNCDTRSTEETIQRTGQTTEMERDPNVIDKKIYSKANSNVTSSIETKGLSLQMPKNAD